MTIIYVKKHLMTIIYVKKHLMTIIYVKMAKAYIYTKQQNLLVGRALPQKFALPIKMKVK